MSEVRPLAEADGDRLVEVLVQAFNFGPALQALYRSIPLSEWRGIEHKGVLQAMLRVIPCGQFFGGRLLRSAAIAAVAVASESRGLGLSSRLLHGVLASLREEGILLTTLFPSVQAVYRRVGYEAAGIYTRVKAVVGGLGIPPVPGVEIERWTDAEFPEIQECYRGFARNENGLMDRSPSFWNEKVLRVYPERVVHRFLVRRGDRVTGYFLYTQEPPGSFDRSIWLRDLVYLDADSARAILGFFGGQRVFVSHASWPSAPDCPLAILVPGEVKADHPDDSYVFMTRLLDVRGALAARGYNQAVNASVELDVRDPLFPESEGGLRLEVEGGAGRVTQGRSARARIDVGALTAVFTGSLSASEAARLGRLEGATTEELSALDAIFSGRKPWLMDTF